MGLSIGSGPRRVDGVARAADRSCLPGAVGSVPSRQLPANGTLVLG
jgi:hypothetical protein